MTKIYAQKAHDVLNFNGSLTTAGSTLSGSSPCAGYSKLIGWFYSSGSSESGSGFRIQQSIDNGTSWLIMSSSTAVTAGGSASYSVNVIGNGIRVSYVNGATPSASIKTLFYLLPI
jgi:hypothetical protein